MTPRGRYLIAVKVWNGKEGRLEPVLEGAMARAGRDLGLPPPSPRLLCRPDSTGKTVCTSTIQLVPGVSTIQGNAAFTKELTGLGANLAAGEQGVDGVVHLRYQAGPRLTVTLALLPSVGTGLDTTVALAPNLPRVEVRARLALILDDYGENAEASARFAGLPGTLTAAVRSNLDDARRVAATARKQGMEVILNLPLEPKNYPIQNPGQDAILVDMSGHEIRQRVRNAVDEVGPVPGVITYMGSLAVEDRDVTRAVLEEIHKKGLFFIDSAGAQFTTVPELAHEVGVPFYETSSISEVDAGHRDPGTIGIRFEDLVNRCRREGYAVGIVHARDGTYQVLADRLPALAREGIVVMGITEVMKMNALQ